MPAGNSFPNSAFSYGLGDAYSTGDVFFVDSGNTSASDGQTGRSRNAPMATINGGIGRCAANNGDIVVVMPGHDENPTASIELDVEGVWVRGLGWGASKPTITFGALAATFAMSAASCRVSGLRFDLGAVATTVTNAIAVTAADCIIENVDTLPHASSQFTNIISVIATGTRVIIRDCFIKSLLTAGASSGIYLDGCDDIQILRTTVMGHFGASACLENLAGSDEILDATIADCFFRNNSSTSGDLAVNLDDAATGMFVNNMVVGGLATTDANYQIGNMGSLASYIVDTDGVDVWGILLGRDAAV